MVPTDDTFFDTLRDQDKHRTGEDYGGTNKTMSTWSVTLLFVAISLVFIAWCLYVSFCAYTCSQSSHVASSNQQNPSEDSKPLSRTERKRLILEYFARSGNQMEVKEGHIIHLKHDDGVFMDIEKGAVSEIEKERGDNHINEDNEDNIVILLLNKTKAPLAPDSGSQAPLEDEETGNSSSSYSKPQALTDGSLSSPSPTPESHDKDGVSPDSSSLFCSTDDNHLKSSSATATSSPLHHTSRQYVHDSCAICLEPYQAGDVVVWSCTESCPHVFHKTCFVDYLLSYRSPGTPCPACRQPFIDECVCNACKTRPKRNASQSEEISPQTPTANESIVASVNLSTNTASDQLVQSVGFLPSI